MTAPLRLHLFGGIRLLGAGGENLAPRSRKMCALLGCLARTPGQALPRERLAGLLWSDRGEEQARASLRQGLAELREAAPRVAQQLLADRLTVALVPGAFAIDAAALEQALAAADLGALAGHLPEVTLPLMAGADGLSPGFDEWLRVERTRFEANLQAGALAAAQAAGPADLEAARIVVSQVQRLFEGHEEAARLGMQLDHRAGDLASLHRRFRLLEAQMQHEFAAEPSSETRQLLTSLTAVAPVGLATGAPAPPMAAARRTGEPPIIVVTPFAVLDGDGQAEALVRVLVHDLEAALCRLPDLRVLSLKHPTPERLERVDSDAIASYQLAGSVRPSAEGLKLAVSLSEIGSGRLVWSHNVEATPGAIGAAIDLAVERIAGAMLPTVERDLMLSRRLEAASPEAHALYLRGRIGVLTARSYAEARAAADLLEQALEADPRSVNARLHLVLCYNGDFMQKIAGHDPAPWRARAMRLAQEAVNLEPGNADANARLGWCHLRLGDSARAESLLRRALELGPHHADNVEQCAIGLALLGEAKEAGDLIQRAFALNPFPRSDYFADQAIALLLQGDAAAARAMFEIGSDPSIQYLAVETACLGLLQETGQSEERLSRLRESLRAIWAGDAPPTDADLLSWLWSVLPFARPAHRALIAQGLHQSGLRPHATAASLSP